MGIGIESISLVRETYVDNVLSMMCNGGYTLVRIESISSPLCVMKLIVGIEPIFLTVFALLACLYGMHELK